MNLHRVEARAKVASTVRARLVRAARAAQQDGRCGPSVLFPMLAAALVVAVVVNAGSGGVHVSPAQVIAILFQRAGVDIDVAFTTQQDAVVWAIRLPRIVMAMLVGAGLALAGAVMQGVYRNPLADPGLIGVSSGSALAAVGVILLGVAPLGTFTVPVAAFLGGAVAAVAVYRMAVRGGRVEVITLILAGIGMNALAGAGIGLGTFLATDAQLRNIVFWSLGSLGGATWVGVSAMTPLAVVGLVAVPWYGRALNLLVLGEREARHLGLDVERVRLRLIALAALLTGAAVAVAGIVGFIGLVTPHIVRLIAGPDHRILLPASALGGATLLLSADLVARTAVLPRELPLGVVTALVGGPFFLWLVLRARREMGGWG